jgi:hypothetical protein
MARILPASANAEFLAAYKVEGMGGCDPATLTVKVWDRWGTAPKDEAAAKGTGEFIAAVVYCKGCDKGVEVHRAQLGG